MLHSDLKKQAIIHKGGKCVLCGYKRCKKALHFHHLNDFEKIVNISDCKTWEEIEQEIDKCVLVCANCHAEIHSGFVDLEILIKLSEL
jgi:hypothetical protein